MNTPLSALQSGGENAQEPIVRGRGTEWHARLSCPLCNRVGMNQDGRLTQIVVIWHEGSFSCAGSCALVATKKQVGLVCGLC